jgi:hypothetical protein
MAQWVSIDLRSSWEGLNTVLNQAKTATQALQVGVNAAAILAKSAGSLVPETISALSNIPVSTALGLVSTLISDFTGSGFYFLPVFPKRFDYSRAILKEQIANLEAEIQKLPPGPLTEDGLDLYTKLEELRLKDAFSSSDLIFEYPYANFIQDIITSLDDEGDKSRPQLGATSLITGAILAIGATTIQDFVTAGEALLQIFRNGKIKRHVKMASRALSVAKSNTSKRQAVSTPPDWKSATLAKLFGIENAIAEIKNSLNNFTALDNLNVQITNYANDVSAALDESINALQQLVNIFGAIADFNASASILYIPPVDGFKTLHIATGDSFQVPNAVHGNIGLKRLLSTTTNNPTSRYTMGVVILASAPSPILGSVFAALGKDPTVVDIEDILNSTLSSAQATSIITGIQSTVTGLDRQFRLLKSLMV